MKKPGRKPALDPRTTRVNVRLSGAEVAMLDARRGTVRRPAFLRALLVEHDRRVREQQAADQLTKGRKR